MSRPRHPNKEIEQALQYAESKQWRVTMSQGHSWGRIWCPHNQQGGCHMSIWSTPKNPQNYAKKIIRYVDNCPH